MNQEIESTIKRLNFENFIWVVLIIASALDIYGDEQLKKSLLYNDHKAEERATNLFLGLAVVSFLVYIYFLFRNYSDYKKYKNKSYEVRFIGSILVLCGTICFLYFQLTTKNQKDSPSNV